MITDQDDLLQAIKSMEINGIQQAPYALNDQYLAQFFAVDPLVGMVYLDSLGPDTTSDIIKAGLNTITLNDTLKYKHNTLIRNGKRYFLVEGDLLLGEAEYMRYLMWLRRRSLADTVNVGKLVGEVLHGQYVRQPPGEVLKYAVIRSTFDTDEQYMTVVQNMSAAARDWEGTCDVRFEHVKARDRSLLLEPTEDLSFIVTGYESNGAFIALAFFPYQPRSERLILVDRSYFRTTYDRIGVFRHELGHVLGWRHEAARAEAPLACQGELLNGTINHTQYDPKSVMHYFCEGTGTIDLKISEIDRAGAQMVYGPPRPR